MLTKKIKTTTGDIILAMPEKLEEITLGQLIEVQQTNNLSDLQAISILSNTPLADVQNIIHTDDLELFITQLQTITHQIKQLYNNDVIPRKIAFTIDNKKVSIKVKSNLSMEPAGAFMASREIITDEIAKYITEHGETNWQENFSPSLAACAQILAQYFYCQVTGKPYNDYAATVFETQVKHLSITDALPIAKYFFLSFPNLSRKRTGFWHLLRQYLSSVPA